MRPLIAVLCFFALVAPANATVTALNEPPIVKGSTDVFWFYWLNDSPSTTYSLCYWVSVNGGSFVRPSGLSCSGTGGGHRAADGRWRTDCEGGSQCPGLRR